jgi:hypothetical protein
MQYIVFFRELGEEFYAETNALNVAGVIADGLIDLGFKPDEVNVMEVSV